MSYSHYDRLTAIDATFLALEDENVHMHVGAITIFDGGALVRDDGGLDFARVRRLAGPALRRNRRFRQRLEQVPLVGAPVWVDDARFQLDYHLRHTALPEPGDERLLKRLFARVMSQKLDVHKPLWEMWFVEGLEGGRFAVITKVHHCMIDGVSGVDLLAMLMDPAAEAEAAQAEEEAATPRDLLPRPAPTPLALLVDETRRRLALPIEALRSGLDTLAHPIDGARRLAHAVEALKVILEPGIEGSSHTPLNPDIGPHRRFDWMRTDIATAREIKKKLGGTLNDVVLACVAGGVRRFLEGRGVPVDDLVFRAQVPVDVRAPEEHGELGNRVAMLVAELPVAEADPRRRYERVVETMLRLKASRQTQGTLLLEKIGEWTSKELLAAVVHMTSAQRAFNIVVTNVPGPQVSVEMLGCRMREIYPLVPLFSNQAVGVALFSYDGALHWGLNADWDAVPDLHDLLLALQGELALLAAL